MRDRLVTVRSEQLTRARFPAAAAGSSPNSESALLRKGRMRLAAEERERVAAVEAVEYFVETDWRCSG